MEHEMEITERLREAVVDALRMEMMRGWSLDQLAPMLYVCVDEAIDRIEGGK